MLRWALMTTANETPRPLWELYPEPPASLRWRMGDGEDAMEAWVSWWDAQGPEERSRYATRHPAPAEWAEWAAGVSYGE